MPVSFDLFGTLVAAQRPDDPAAAVAAELRERAVPVPDDWAAAYREPHADVPAGAERSLSAHVADALESRGVDADEEVARDATLAAFDRPVPVRDGAHDAVAAARDHGRVAVLSNCSVHGLVVRALARTDLTEEFDAVVGSVDCGWRKPHENAFRAVADALDAPTSDLVHVGDDPEADGGVESVGGRAVLLSETPLTDVPAELEGEPCR